nr:response regulator transcription factor [Kibdelosporangium sp. MJ126-NF4]CEL12842.1 regulatory protein, LuxR:Response regulator receiver [Kibdelosporangium sp. MJ126-NF4]CTQ98528.1 regulatory protein, LuxR:Response regulator receiver [Kibdelosporangium sp. MJ126-NF4]
MTVSVLLVDDHPFYRSGVRLALADAGSLRVVGEAQSGKEALDAVLSVRPHVVLMDIALPDRSGIGITREIVSAADLTDGRPRVIIVSASDDDDSVVAAIRAGALGYLVKNTARDELLRAVHLVARGSAVFSPVIAERLGDYFSVMHDVPTRALFPKLTQRERQILDLVARGLDNRRIARQLVLSERTVRNHVTHVLMKLEVTTRADAAIRAKDAGLGR